MGGELLEAIKLDQTLDGVPSGFGKPVLKRGRARSIGSQRAVNEELHLSLVVLSLKLSLLHESESQQRKEDLLVAFEETTSDPLVDLEANLLYEIKHTGVIIFIWLGSLNSLEEVDVERLKGVLVHVVDNT